MNITIKMPIEDWNDLTYLMIEAEAFIHGTGKYGPVPKSAQDKYEKGAKRALEILKNAREAHDDEVKPISFGVDFGKGESIGVETTLKGGKIVGVKYD